MVELVRLLDYIRGAQPRNAPRELRIVLESRQLLAPACVQADIEPAYHLTASVKPRNHRRSPRISTGRACRPAIPHDRRRLHLVFAEPDLSTDFFMGEPEEEVKPGTESVSDIAFWCACLRLIPPRCRLRLPALN